MFHYQVSFTEKIEIIKSYFIAILGKSKKIRFVQKPIIELLSFENMVSDLKILSPMWYQQDHESFNPSVKL